jgi:hypothetical protein
MVVAPADRPAHGPDRNAVMETLVTLVAFAVILLIAGIGLDVALRK